MTTTTSSGGPLQNIPQDAVQEFQVATNRFSAELGRSAGSVINVVTRSGGDVARGSAAIFLRDQAWQALPATLDRELVGTRRSTASSSRRPSAARCSVRKCSPLARWKSATRTAGRWSAFATPSRGPSGARTRAAPLDDLLTTARADWRASTADDVIVRYSGQREDDISSSALDRAIGTASQRQQSRNRLHSVLGTWTRVLSSRAVNSLSVSYSDFENTIAPVARACS